MKKLVGPLFLALAIVAGILVLLSRDAQAQTGPSGTLNLRVTSEQDRAVEASGTYENSYGGYAVCLYWGHETDGQAEKVCFDGISDEFAVTHQYPSAGVFTATLVVEGMGGPFITEEVVSFFDPPSGSIAASVYDNTGLIGRVSGSYANATDWGACIIDWGHEGPSNDEVCFSGSNGSFGDWGKGQDPVEHEWPEPGTYEVTFEVNGLDGTKVVYTDTLTFTKPLQWAYLPLMFVSHPPTGSLNVQLTNAATRTVSASGSYALANDWGTCLTWGDEKAGDQPTCFPGEAGNFNNITHQYATKGTYTVTLTINGETKAPTVITRVMEIP